MPDFTSTQLIIDVKREGSVPTNQSLYTDEDFCASFTDCQKTRIIPSVLRTKEEYFVAVKDYEFADLEELDGDRIALTLPDRCIGGRIRMLQLIDQNGVVQNDIPKLNPENTNTFFNGQWFGYVFQSNKLIMPSSIESQLGKIRLQYFRRPNDIVEISRAGKILTIDTGTGNVTLDNMPADFAAGVLVDIISGREPFDSVQDSESLIAAAGITIQVSLATAAKLSVGDYICYQYETVIPQLPVELHPILIQYALSRVLKSLGDTQGASNVIAELPELERNLYELLESRDDGSEKKMIAPNTLWTRGNRPWRW